MKVKYWLTVNSKGQARLSKGKPALDINEVSIFLDIDVPDALFKKPRLEAKIVVPDEAAANDVIESVVLDNVKEVVEQATGLEFAIGIKQPEQEG